MLLPHEFHENEKNMETNKKILEKSCQIVYNDLRCELIAMKREVATQHYRVGFPWSKCQVIIPGDKSLYRTKYSATGRKTCKSAFGRLNIGDNCAPLSLSDERETHG